MEDRLVVPLACSQALDVLGEALDAVLHDDVDEVQRELPAARSSLAGSNYESRRGSDPDNY